MTTFQFTNAYFTDRFVALYSQERRRTMINFNRIAAEISPNVYIVTIISHGEYIGSLVRFGFVQQNHKNDRKTVLVYRKV